MINLALRTEYSFKRCYGFISNIADSAEVAVGIADMGNTFGHSKLQKACFAKHIKPIFGVRLMVIEEQIEKVKTFGPTYIFIAKNKIGLAQIYRLVRKSYERFYYHQQVTIADINKLSPDVIVIANNFIGTDRIDFIGLDHFTPRGIAEYDWDIPKVAINFNWFPRAEDRHVYELHAGPRMMETQTYPQHILSEVEWSRIWGDEEAIANTYVVADMCEHFELPKATMLKYKGKRTLRNMCKQGALKRKIDITKGKYKERLDHELELIERNNFADYFLVVAELVKDAKTRMLVGPSRGSSAGSIVCYLTEITEVDPIKFDLMFERFIDVNRSDLPDIDIDFPDAKRNLVIKSLVNIYGEAHVSHIATIATMKPKSAIGEFAAGLQIPKYQTEAVKDAIISRSSGDARSQLCISDTFTETDVGKDLLNEYPKLALTQEIEGHARHSGVHAAGIIVCNEPLTLYGGVNVRNDVLMMDKNEADKLGLLKIDCLGLRTLSILESVADQIGMKYSEYYDLPLDDEKTFTIFNDLRLDGIFQFQGQALQYVTRQMGVHSFDDVAVITALARPGPIHSGGTNIFINRKTGDSPIEYLSESPGVVNNTKDTLGVIIYQEQLMSIGRDYGDLSWEDVNQLRRASSKSLGDEFFGRYKDKFVKGAVAQGNDEQEAIKVFENMVTFGSWGFNKSHAYGYGLISYWTAWAKAHHPMEFAVAQLNNARSPQSALRILRDLVTNDGIEYIAIDPDHSLPEWSVYEGKLLGGLQTIHGVGYKKAKAIINARNGTGKWTPGMVRTLENAETLFTILFPCQHFWGELYDYPESVGLIDPPVEIETIKGEGEYLFIGKLLDKNRRDLNEYQSIVKRGGKIIQDHTLFLNLIVEDDTDSIVCTVNRFRYAQLGKQIAETGREGTDWYLIRGVIKDKWRRVDVSYIYNLNNWRDENEMEAKAKAMTA